MPQDIVKLPANIKGRDFIVADLHGNKECLDAVLEKLNLGTDDRLFIAGDLVDRGEDSLGIVEALAKYPNVYVIRGNHEEMTFTSIAALEKIAEQIVLENPTAKFTEDECWNKMHTMRHDPLVHGLINHVQENGGEWVLALFIKEYQQGLLSSSSAEISKIRMMQNYMNALPFIIHVEGSEKTADFNVVHAAMPLSDRELARRIEKGEGLSAAEKHHATWARPFRSDRGVEFDNNIGRTIFSPIAYCGHNIVGGNLVCANPEVSMVLLDGGAYYSNVSLVVNHGEQKVSGIKGNMQVGEEPTLRMAFRSTPAYLKEKNQRYLLQKMAIENIDEMVDAAKNGNIREATDELLQKVNGVIEWLGESDIEVWDAVDYFTLLNADASVESGKVRILLEAFTADVVRMLETTEMTEDELNYLQKDMQWLLQSYNYYHQPAQPFYHRFFLLPPPAQPAPSQQGFFAEDKGKIEEALRATHLQEMKEPKKNL